MVQIAPSTDVRGEAQGDVHPDDPTCLFGAAASPGAVRESWSEKKKVDGAWQAYRLANRELYMSSFIRVPSVFYKARWWFTRVMHRRLLVLRGLTVTVGEVVVLTSILLLSGWASYWSCCGYKATGDLTCVPFVLVFLFSSRHSVVTFMTGMPYERLLFYHKLFAILALAFTAVHAFTYKGTQDTVPEQVAYDTTGTGWMPRSGVVLTSAHVAMLLGSLYIFRRRLFEAFLRVHYFLAVVIIVISVLHHAFWVSLGAALWAIEWLFRALVILNNRSICNRCIFHRLPGDVVKISFPTKGFMYRGGQHFMICIPQVSYFEWHPFSISSAPHEPMTTMHVRVLGDWTQKLHSLLEAGRVEEMPVLIDGPFGGPSIDLDHNYRLFMFVSGGIGITPMQSILNEILTDRTNGRPLDKVMFIWSVRDRHLMEATLDFEKDYYRYYLPQDLPASFQPDLLRDSRNFHWDVLEAHYYLTRVRDVSEFEIGNIDPEVQPWLRFGRPHLPDHFERMREIAASSATRDVAVLTCGPPAMTADVARLCAKLSTRALTFHFHGETFEM